MTNEYMAGIIDGEGNVAVQYSNRSYLGIVTVVNTNLELMVAISSTFGGKIRKLKKYKKQHSISYSLRWWGRNAQQLLSKVLPFLIVKRKYAEAVISFEKERAKQPINWRTDEWKQYAKGMYQQTLVRKPCRAK